MQNNATHTLVSIDSVKFYLSTMFGITDIDENTILDSAQIALPLIGNIYTSTYLYEGTADSNGDIFLPCNVGIIKSVSIGTKYHPCKRLSIIGTHSCCQMEEVSENEFQGNLINFEFLGNKVKINSQYKTKVHIIYGGYTSDDNGLPMIDEKTAIALAHYCNMNYQRKKVYSGIGRADLLQMAIAEWQKACNQARVSDYITDNFIDGLRKILKKKDIWQYGKRNNFRY
jgi:hypothetical protein